MRKIKLKYFAKTVDEIKEPAEFVSAGSLIFSGSVLDFFVPQLRKPAASLRGC
jgi:hypothetical protein